MSNVEQHKASVSILVPMGVERFPAFVEAASASHAADNVASGHWETQEAGALARAELERLLPGGHGTPDHYFYEIKTEPEGVALGFVWFASLARGSGRVAYLYQLLVYPQHRRRGHARAALAAFESLARAQGITALALNVFGSNVSAQELYRSAGYLVTSMSMHKELPPGSAA